MIWTDSYLDSQFTAAEQSVSTDITCIFNRFSLDIILGTSVYTLPSGILGILAVSWKGEPIYPLEHTTLRDSAPYYLPLNAGSQSKPYHYLRVGYGYSKIEFRPVPSESIAADDTNIYGSDIANRVIISCWKVADSSNQLPEFARRRLLKYYVLWKAFAKEGKGQNLKASDYFKLKFDYEKTMFKLAVDNVSKCIVRKLSSIPIDRSRTNFPPSPVLPARYRNT